MQQLLSTALAVHIAAGFTAFFMGPVAMMSRKGGKLHRFVGKIFFWSMTAATFSALVMAPLKQNIFLTLIAVFSFYLAFSGYRSIYRKDMWKKRNTSFIDWFFAVLNTVFSIALVLTGFFLFSGMGVILCIAFGGIGAWLGIRDMISFLKPSGEKKKWLFSHMTGMVASYIAAVSAFSAVNLNFDWMPGIVQWLWPTVIGTPLLVMWIRHYQRKYPGKRSIGEQSPEVSDTNI